MAGVRRFAVQEYHSRDFFYLLSWFVLVWFLWLIYQFFSGCKILFSKKSKLIIRKQWAHVLLSDLFSPERGYALYLYRYNSKTECDIRMDFDTNEYPNIFVSRKWHERISEYIRMKFFETNEYTNIFVSKFWYERISE